MVHAIASPITIFCHLSASIDDVLEIDILNATIFTQADRVCEVKFNFRLAVKNVAQEKT